MRFIPFRLKNKFGMFYFLEVPIPNPITPTLILINNVKNINVPSISNSFSFVHLIKIQFQQNCKVSERS